MSLIRNLCITSVFVLIVGITPVVAAQSSARYCGIYSVYALCKYHKVNVVFESLIDESFVSDFEGSTISDLKLALEFCGLEAKAYRGLSKESLKAAKAPVILHVATRGQLAAHNHWMLFINRIGDNAIVVGDQGTQISIPFGELLARWDGIAISAYRKDSMQYHELWAAESYYWIGCLFGGSLSIFVGTLLMRRRFLIVAAATVAILLVSNFRRTGDSQCFWDASRYVTSTLGNLQYPHVDFEFVRNCVSNQSAILVDARDMRSCSFGMIPGARNIPLDSLDSDFSVILGTPVKNKKIIVYCQSHECAFADSVASVLGNLGYSNVSVYSGGYREWAQLSK